MHKTYQALAADYEQIGAPQFMSSMAFLDAHKLPMSVTSLRAFGRQDFRAHVGGRKYSQPINAIDGIKFVSALKSCIVGATGDLISEVAGEQYRENGLSPKDLQFLLWKMDDAR